VHFVAAASKPEVAADAKIYDARGVRRVRAAPAVRAPRRACKLCRRFAALALHCAPTLTAPQSPLQVDSVVAAALSRNAELAEIEAALAAAEAERAPGGDDDDGDAHGAESAGEGDLEDDFITAVLDAETGPSSESEEECEEEYDEEEDEAAQAAMAAAAARARAARAPRPLDAAFDALASAEYSDTDIGCAAGERSAAWCRSADLLLAFRDLDHDAAAARGTSDVASYGRVLSAFRDSSAGAEACATVADKDAARRRARAMALAEREADDAAGSDDDEGDSEGAEASSESSDGESEEDPEEQAAREALQVTRISLGLPPSARLAGAPGVAARPLPLRGVVLPEDEEVVGDDAELPATELVRIVAEPRDRWDCETIVSTYSNLENRPAVLDGGAPRRARGGAASSAAGAAAMPAQIRLGKTGLPVEFVPSRAKAAVEERSGSDSDDDDSDGGADVGPGAAWRADTRRKGETAEEKRARKAAVKEGRREARATKKETKTMFKQAQQASRSVPVNGAVRPGASVTPLL
jgi:protein LTV1